MKTESLRGVEKSREEVKRVELRRSEMEQLWDLLQRLELRWSEKSCEAVVTIEKGWGKLTTNSENRVAKLWGLAAAPLGKTCFCGPIAYSSALLVIGHFRRPACPGFTCCNMNYTVRSKLNRHRLFHFFSILKRAIAPCWQSALVILLQQSGDLEAYQYQCCVNHVPYYA